MKYILTVIILLMSISVVNWYNKNDLINELLVANISCTTTHVEPINEHVAYAYQKCYSIHDNWYTVQNKTLFINSYLLKRWRVDWHVFN